MTDTDVKLGWHFAAIKDEKPVLRDGRPLIVGEWLEHTGPAVICHSGLHLSVKALDALNYAPGPFVTRVEYADVRDTQDDKLVCTRRRPVYGYDATPTLLAWARKVASDVLHLWDAPQAVVDFLRTGGGADAALRAADYTADYAARAADCAAHHAARAAHYATRYAIRAAAYPDITNVVYNAYTVTQHAAYAHYGTSAVPFNSPPRAKYNTWLEQALKAARPEEAENVG